MLLTWWTCSELRNWLPDNQENLKWGFTILNTAFFVLLRELGVNAGKRTVPELGLISAAMESGQTDVQVGRLASEVFGCLKDEVDGTEE